MFVLSEDQNTLEVDDGDRFHTLTAADDNGNWCNGCVFSSGDCPEVYVDGTKTAACTPGARNDKRSIIWAREK